MDSAHQDVSDTARWIAVPNVRFALIFTLSISAIFLRLA